MQKKIFTIGITGGSGSGKTFFLKSLSQQFTDKEICFISQDHYYRARDLQVTDENGVKNFDLPGAIEREKFHDDIIRLKRGETLHKQEYTFNNPNATPKILEFIPTPVVIIEGLFVQYFEEIDQELDLRIFIEAKDHLKLSRRIKRDNTERGYDLDDVLYRYQNHVMPVYDTLIKPLKHRADLIIPNNSHMNVAINVISTFIRAVLDRK